MKKQNPRQTCVENPCKAKTHVRNAFKSQARVKTSNQDTQHIAE